MYKNIYNKNLQICSTNPMTGYHRDGYCRPNINDRGKHLVCAKMDENFLEYTASQGNDLSSVVRPNQKWCLCQDRWKEAYIANKAPEVVKEATHLNAKSIFKKSLFKKKRTKRKGGKRRKKRTKKKSHKKRTKSLFKKKSRKRRKQKLQFLYNPNNPKKSFDVYINKNPSDTIPIKYTTVEDVKHTIKKLESLFKRKAYPHKRIWQVGMILKVRLEAMKKHKKTKFPNAKNVTQRFNLANAYFKFLGKRSKLKTFKERKALVFKN